VLDFLKLSGDIEWVPASEVIDGAVAQLTFDPKDGKRDTRRQRVLRAIDGLCADRHLAASNGKLALRGD
jgi:hypothetical protein